MNSDEHRSISFVLATHNRRAILTKTLARLLACGLDRRQYEIIVVDNASSDGTAEAVTPVTDRVIRLRRNAGSCAKTFGVDAAIGRYIVFLDDDSHPHAGSMERMIEHFERDPALGAAGFTVHLPNGQKEGAALPDVFLGCGVGFRAEALRSCGGLDRSFFMQAEEYDLTFRLTAGGWGVTVFDDLHVEHLKTSHARKSERTTYYDIRNNLRVAARYLPAPYYAVYREDWIQRYRWLARRDGHRRWFDRGTRAGLWRGAMERRSYRRYRLSTESLEHFFRWKYVRGKMTELTRSGARRIVLADLGKNVFAFVQAAKDNQVEVMAIGDDRFAGAGRCYRGIPIVSPADALELEPDAVVVANSSTVHGTNTYLRILARSATPVHHWFGPILSAVEAPSLAVGVEQLSR